MWKEVIVRPFPVFLQQYFLFHPFQIHDSGICFSLDLDHLFQLIAFIYPQMFFCCNDMVVCFNGIIQQAGNLPCFIIGVVGCAFKRVAGITVLMSRPLRS